MLKIQHIYCLCGSRGSAAQSRLDLGRTANKIVERRWVYHIDIFPKAGFYSQLIMADPVALARLWVSFSVQPIATTAHWGPHVDRTLMILLIFGARHTHNTYKKQQIIGQEASNRIIDPVPAEFQPSPPMRFRIVKDAWKKTEKKP